MHGDPAGHVHALTPYRLRKLPRCSTCPLLAAAA